jgi:hypothetical protein
MSPRVLLLCALCLHTSSAVAQPPPLSPATGASRVLVTGATGRTGALVYVLHPPPFHPVSGTRVLLP